MDNEIRYRGVQIIQNVYQDRGKWKSGWELLAPEGYNFQSAHSLLAKTLEEAYQTVRENPLTPCDPDCSCGHGL